VRRFLKRVVGLGFFAGVAYALWRHLEQRRAESELAWEPQPFPYPPAPRAGAGEGAPEPVAPPWVEPTGDACPATHPVKAKLSSRIFHVPGGASYDRTNPDRCYRDEAAAKADGLRPAAR
jgi:hypothetical protein